MAMTLAAGQAATADRFMTTEGIVCTRKPIGICVINLARSADRREKMSSMLARHGLEFEFYDGVDGALLSPHEISSVYEASAAFDRLGREMHPNEMACSWSHIKIYEMLVKRGPDEVLILEDDIDLAPEFADVLACRESWLPPNWRVVNFAYDMARPISVATLPTPKLDHLSLCRFDALVGRTGAYLLNREGARSLVKAAYPIRMPPDDLLGNAEFVGTSVYGIAPRIAMWDDEFHSTIWTDTTREQFAEMSRGSLHGISRRLRRRSRKLMGQLV